MIPGETIRSFLVSVAEEYEVLADKQGGIDGELFWHSIGGALLDGVEPSGGAESAEYSENKRYCADLMIAGIQRVFEEIH